MLEISNSTGTFMRKSKSGSTTTIYLFNCSDCGSEIRCQKSRLLTHSGRCVSCSHKGRPYEYMWNEMKRSYRLKDVEVTISYKELISLISIGECHYCNDTLIYNKHTRDDSGEHVSRAYQLDRMDPSKGYISGNLVPCCWDCNRIKSNKFTYDEFILFSPALRKIKKNRKNEKL